MVWWPRHCFPSRLLASFWSDTAMLLSKLVIYLQFVIVFLGEAGCYWTWIISYLPCMFSPWAFNWIVLVVIFYIIKCLKQLYVLLIPFWHIVNTSAAWLSHLLVVDSPIFDIIRSNSATLLFCTCGWPSKEMPCTSGSFLVPEEFP